MGMTIKNLSDSNYLARKQKVLLLLALKYLFQYVHENVLESDEESTEKWAREYRKAQAVIGLSLSD